VYCPTVEYIRPRGAPLQKDRPYYSATHLNSLHSQFRELPCNLIHQAYSPGRRVLRISKRPEPVNIVHCPSCIWHEPFCYSRRRCPTPKNTSRGNPGCAVGPKTPTLAESEALIADLESLSKEAPDVKRHASNFEPAETVKSVPLDPSNDASKQIRIGSELDPK
jgi:hypothetical protein